MLIFIDLAHLFMRRGHCFSTHYLAERAAIPPVRSGTWELVENTTKPTDPFVGAPAHACHLPGLVIIIIVPMQTRPLAHQVGRGRKSERGGGVMFGRGGGGGIPAGNPLCEARERRTRPLQTAGLYAEVQGLLAAVSSCSSDHFDTNALRQLGLLPQK